MSAFTYTISPFYLYVKNVRHEEIKKTRENFLGSND